MGLEQYLRTHTRLQHQVWLAHFDQVITREEVLLSRMWWADLGTPRPELNDVVPAFINTMTPREINPEALLTDEMIAAAESKRIRKQIEKMESQQRGADGT